MNSDRGALQLQFDFGDEAETKPLAKLLRQEPTDPAHVGQPSLSASPADALMEQVVDTENLERAWRQVKRNRGAPGPDGLTIKQFEGWAGENWPAVRQQLLDGTYRPNPVRRRPTLRVAARRLLGIPNVVDRLIQQAICQVLTPIFDPGFSATNAARRCPVSAFVPAEVPTEPRSRFRRSSGKATLMPSTLTCRSFSTAFNMTS